MKLKWKVGGSGFILWIIYLYVDKALPWDEIVKDVLGAFPAFIENMLTLLFSDELIAAWHLVTIFSILIGIIVLSIAFYIYLRFVQHQKNRPSLSYFEEVTFDTMKESEKPNLFNPDKAVPSYVHVAPKRKEADAVAEALELSDGHNVVQILGKPGEGKSLLAFQAAYQWKSDAKKKYRVYRLINENVKDKADKDTIEEIFSQLYELKGKRVLVLIDDAHQLALKRDLKLLLKEEKNIRFLWIETQFEEDADPEAEEDSSCFRLDFNSFKADLFQFYLDQMQVDDTREDIKDLKKRK